jgi:hypothetical protein
MNKTLIWNISSEGTEFPLDFRKNPKLSIQINHVKLEDMFHLQFPTDTINIVYLKIDEKNWKEINTKFSKNFSTHPHLQLVLVQVEDAPSIEGKQEGNILVLEYPYHKNEIKVIIEKTIQAELYKRTSIEIGESCIANFGFYEGLFELAREENKQKQDTLKAFEKMMEYETKIKKSQNELLSAIERVNQLREKELLELHERIKATEVVEELKNQELKIALEESAAKDAVLQFSRIEEINMEKIIKAQNKLFEYSDQEIKDLIQENIDLKKKLGIPIDSQK